MHRGGRALDGRFQNGFRGQEKFVFGLDLELLIAFIAGRQRLNLIKNGDEIGSPVDVQAMDALAWQGCQQKNQKQNALHIIIRPNSAGRISTGLRLIISLSVARSTSKFLRQHPVQGYKCLLMKLILD